MTDDGPDFHSAKQILSRPNRGDTFIHTNEINTVIFTRAIHRLKPASEAMLSETKIYFPIVDEQKS